MCLPSSVCLSGAGGQISGAAVADAFAAFGAGAATAEDGSHDAVMHRTETRDYGVVLSFPRTLFVLVDGKVG